MFRGIVVADSHLRLKPPPSRVSFVSDFEAKWTELCDLAKSISASVIVFLGDIFHPIASSSVSHGLVVWAISLLKRAPCPVLTIAGNHDIRLDGSLDHLLRRPLGVLIRSGVLRFVNEHTMDLYDGVQISGSWCPMTINTDIKKFLLPERNPKAKACIFLTHGDLIFPSNRTWSKLYFKVEELDRLRPLQDIHLNGHIHIQQALWKGRSCKYGSPGAIMRGFDSKGTLNEVVKAIIVEVDDAGNSKLKFYTLKSQQPFDKVFKVEELKKSKERGQEMSKFVGMLADEVERIAPEEDLLGTIQSMKLPQAVLAKCQEYLVAAEQPPRKKSELMD